MQIDLIDIQQLAQWNDGFKYIVCIEDGFSRKLWARLTKTRTAKEVVGVIAEVIDGLDQPPESVFTDKGTEMKNATFKRYLANKGIRFDHPSSEVKAGLVERLNRSIQKYKNLNIDNARYLTETFYSF